MANGHSLNIVLVHGFPGFSQVGELDYFKGVEDHLKREFSSRNIKISTPALGAVADVETRAGKLKDDIEKKFKEKEFKGEKVHIIAHSGGGLDARWLASPHPLCLSRADLVSSITTISTPHGGALAADLFADVVPKVADKAFKPLVARLPANPFNLSWPGRLVSRAAGHAIRLSGTFRISLGHPRNKLLRGFLRTVPDAFRLVKQLTDLEPETIRAFSTKEMEKFNKKVTDADGVTYNSYAGVRDVTKSDPPAPIFFAPHLLLLLDGKENDGWVTVESAKWGEFKGKIAADHADEIGHDLTPPGGIPRSAFDHLTFYEEIVGELADA